VIVFPAPPELELVLLDDELLDEPPHAATPSTSTIAVQKSTIERTFLKICLLLKGVRHGRR
jgi:hypothetical protein